MEGREGKGTGISTRFGTAHLQMGKPLPPLYNGGVHGSDHSLQGQRIYRGHHPCCQAQYLPVFQVSTFLTPGVCLMEGSSLQGRQR